MDASCTSTLLAVEMDAPCTSTLLAVKMDAPYTSTLLTVEMDAPCTSTLLTVEMDAPCMSTLLTIEMDAPCTSTPQEVGRGTNTQTALLAVERDSTSMSILVPHADENRIEPCRVQQQRGSRDHQYQ